MIIVLEDHEADTKLIVDALVEQQIEPDAIKTFKTISDANEFMAQIDKRSAAPIAIIADVDLGPGFRNGINFIQDQYLNYETVTGGGIWTILVSGGDLISPFGLPAPLPHATFDKTKEDWQRTCAKLVSSLCVKSLPFDGAQNDLAPPGGLAIPPSDRIYLFCSGEACRLALEGDDPAQPLFGIQRPHYSYYEQVNPILMYRGRYVVVGKYKKAVPPHLTRALLRWRRVTLAPCYGDSAPYGTRINIKQIHSWTFDEEAQGMLLDEERGFHLRSVHNDVTYLRNHDDVKSLCNFLFDGSDKKQLPAFPSKKGFPDEISDIKIDNTKFNGFVLPFPATRNAERQLTDCFIARLHFVLTDEEVNNYEEWRQEWKQHFPPSAAPKPPLSR